MGARVARRIARIAGIVLGSLVVLGLAAVALLSVPAVREGLLSAALRRADAALPGTLLVADARWPSLGHLELESLRWTADGDTLAEVRRLGLQCRLGELRRGDVHLDSLVVEGLRADLPALRRAFPPGAQEPAPEKAGATSSFPRMGSLPPLPSVAVGELRLDAPSVVLSVDHPPARLALAGSLDLRREEAPRIDLREVRVDDPATELTVGPGTLVIDLQRGDFRGTLPGRWREDWPFRLAARSGEDDRFTLELELPGEPQVRAGVLVDGTRRRDADGSAAADVRISAELPPVRRLAAIPELADALGALPPEERLTLTAEGTVAFGGEPRTRLHVRTGSFATIDSVEADVRTGGDRTAISGLRLSARGLRITGSWSVEEGLQTIDADADLRGTAWLAPFAPDLTLPDSVALRARTHLTGPATDLVGESAVHGRLALGSTRIDSLDVALSGAHTGGGWLDWRVAALSRELWLTGDGRVKRDGAIDVEMSPLLVTTIRTDPGERHPGRVSVAAGGSAVSAQNVRLEGALGTLRVDGQWKRGGTGRATADLRWPSPPALLVQRLDAPPDSLAALAKRWSQAGDLGVRIEAAGSRDAWRADAELRLPGPALLEPVLSSGLDVSGLALLEGSAHARGAADSVTASLDAGATPWLESARAELRIAGARAVLDTLRLEAFGVRVAGSGVRDGEVIRASARVDLDGLDGLRALVPSLPADLELAAAADARISGSAADPDAEIDVSATARGPDLEMPGMRGRVDVAAGAIARVQASGTDTLRVGSLTFHRWSVEARPLGKDASALMPLLASVDVEGPDLAWLQVASIEQDGGWLVQTDTLGVRLHDRDLRSARPFSVHWAPADSALSVTDLELDGTLGSIRADGAVGTAATDLRVRAELDGLPSFVASGIPPGLRPQRVDATLHVARRDSLRLEATAGGLALGDRRGMEARVTGDWGAGGARADFTVSDGAGEAVRGHAHLDRLLDACSLAFFAPGDPCTVAVKVDGLPLPERADPAALRSWWAGTDDGPDPILTGDVSVGAAPGSPVARLDAAVTFPRWPDLGSHRIDVEADADSTGIRSRFAWKRGDEAIATADAWLAGGFASAAAGSAASWTPGDSLSVHVVMKDWQLEDVDALAPPTVRATGQLACDLRAEGPPAAARLDGWFEARGIAVSTARGDRAHAEGRLEISGTTAAPQADGKLVVQQGRLLIPEPPRSLHDTHGQALLWSESTGPDSVAADTSSAADTSATSPAAPPIDLGIDVSIPGGFRIRGRGLDVEMAGDLNLVLSDRKLRVDGELRAVGGSLSLFGNRFVVERGTAVFYGTEDIDPDLDIRLSQQKGDVHVLVHVTGPASSPRIDLSSEPPLEEADILSHLFFSRSSEDLDREQSGFVQKQAAAALRMFAMPGLERQLGWRLGLDVVRLGTTGDQNESLSLVVGKYLSPRVLLTYDQGLDSPTDAAVNLEYWITRHVRLETRSSRHAQSAVEMSWTRDY